MSVTLAAVGAIAVAAPLAAQEVGPSGAVPAVARDARLQTRVPFLARAGVIEIAEAAAREGLPVEPLVQRALEGASRGAEPARIVEAVAETAARLRMAQRVLGREAGETELVAGAAALLAGVGEGDLRRLRVASGRRPLAVPLVTLADLLERGVPAATSVSVILALVDAGVGADAYARLRQSVAEDIRQGAPPAAAARTRADGVLVERQPPAPAQRPGRSIRLPGSEPRPGAAPPAPRRPLFPG